MRYAVIDLGSNTFHLLIVQLDFNARSYQLIFRKRVYVYLSAGGLEAISQSAAFRGMQALLQLQSLCRAFEVEEQRLIGTSMLRSASNADAFLRQVKDRCGWDVELISGQREAQLIHKAIKSEVKMSGENLILDVGGGSVEFIIDVNGQLVEAVSVQQGISVLRAWWGRQDPPSEQDVSRATTWLDGFKSQLQDILRAQPVTLVGASGPFEILSDMMGPKNSYERWEVLSLLDKVLTSSLSDRSDMPGMPKSRADMSIESLFIVRWVLDRFPSITQVSVAMGTLKEGVILERIFKLP